MRIRKSKSQYVKSNKKVRVYSCTFHKFILNIDITVLAKAQNICTHKTRSYIQPISYFHCTHRAGRSFAYHTHTAAHYPTKSRLRLPFIRLCLLCFGAELFRSVHVARFLSSSYFVYTGVCALRGGYTGHDKCIHCEHDAFCGSP